MAHVVEQVYRPEVSVADLKPHPRNPRKGDVAAIEESIASNGFYGSVLAQTSTGYILAGEHRWRAAQANGLTTVPVTYLDVDAATAMRILLADNRTNDLAWYDDGGLARLLQDVEQQGGGLSGTGYDTRALDMLLRRVSNEPVELPGQMSAGGLDDPRGPGGLPGGGAASGGGYALSDGDDGDLPQPFRQQITTPTGALEPPDVVLDRYNTTALRQILLVMNGVEYAAVLPWMRAIAAREHLDSNADVFFYLLSEYASAHPDATLPAVPTPGLEDDEEEETEEEAGAEE